MSSTGSAQDHLSLHHRSPAAEKTACFRSLFRGRTDVFPQRFESPKTGRAGYSPACRNEWVRGICETPQNIFLTPNSTIYLTPNSRPKFSDHRRYLLFEPHLNHGKIVDFPAFCRMIRSCQLLQPKPSGWKPVSLLP